MLTDTELIGLMRGGESDRVEFKSSIADRSKLRKTICAFANECEVAVVIVEPSIETPVRYEGRCWVRVGSTNREATVGEETRLAERRRAANLPYDMRPSNEARVEDLDLDFFRREYLPLAIDAEVLQQNQRSVNQQLESLRLTIRGIPTNGAILILGRDPRRWIPGAYVQFLRIGGVNVTEPIRDQREISGPLHQVFRELDILLGLNITTAADVVSSPREVRHPDYPPTALVQITRNALIHRSYEGTNAPAKIYWFSDRIEIMNPGGLYGQVTAENFGKGATDYRNPLLAEAAKLLGYVQRFGMGIPLAMETLRKNGNPDPQFEFQPTQFLVTVRPPA